MTLDECIARLTMRLELAGALAYTMASDPECRDDGTVEILQNSTRFAQQDMQRLKLLLDMELA